MGEGDGAVIVEGEIDGAGSVVEGCGADWGRIVWVVAAVDFHVGFGGEEGAAVEVDGVGCGLFVGGEDGEVVGEEGGAVDVEEAGGWGGWLGWVGGGCGGGGVGEVVV